MESCHSWRSIKETQGYAKRICPVEAFLSCILIQQKSHKKEQEKLCYFVYTRNFVVKLTPLNPSLLGSKRTNLSSEISPRLENSLLLEIMLAAKSVLIISLLNVLMGLVPIMSL